MVEDKNDPKEEALQCSLEDIFNQCEALNKLIIKPCLESTNKLKKPNAIQKEILVSTELDKLVEEKKKEFAVFFKENNITYDVNRGLVYQNCLNDFMDLTFHPKTIKEIKSYQRLKEKAEPKKFLELFKKLIMESNKKREDLIQDIKKILYTEELILKNEIDKKSTDEIKEVIKKISIKQTYSIYPKTLTNSCSCTEINHRCKFKRKIQENFIYKYSFIKWELKEDLNTLKLGRNSSKIIQQAKQIINNRKKVFEKLYDLINKTNLQQHLSGNSQTPIKTSSKAEDVVLTPSKNYKESPPVIANSTEKGSNKQQKNIMGFFNKLILNKPSLSPRPSSDGFNSDYDTFFMKYHLKPNTIIHSLKCKKIDTTPINNISALIVQLQPHKKTYPNKQKHKLIQFCNSLKPAYFGRFKTLNDRPRFRNTTHRYSSLDYEYDTDLEWEADEQGEILESNSNASDDDYTNEEENEEDINNDWLIKNDDLHSSENEATAKTIKYKRILKPKEIKIIDLDFNPLTNNMRYHKCHLKPITTKNQNLFPIDPFYKSKKKTKISNKQ